LFIGVTLFDSLCTTIAYNFNREIKTEECLIVTGSIRLQGTLPSACRRGRPRMAWMDNINTWTGLPMKESIRMTKDRDKWRKYVHGVANPRIEDG